MWYIIFSSYYYVIDMLIYVGGNGCQNVPMPSWQGSVVMFSVSDPASACDYWTLLTQVCMTAADHWSHLLGLTAGWLACIV